MYFHALSLALIATTLLATLISARSPVLRGGAISGLNQGLSDYDELEASSVTAGTTDLANHVVSVSTGDELVTEDISRIDRRSDDSQGEEPGKGTEGQGKGKNKGSEEEEAYNNDQINVFNNLIK